MRILHRRPWLPILLGYLSFIALWIWFAWFAIQHSPQVVESPPPPHG